MDTNGVGLRTVARVTINRPPSAKATAGNPRVDREAKVGRPDLCEFEPADQLAETGGHTPERGLGACNQGHAAAFPVRGFDPVQIGPASLDAMPCRARRYEALAYSRPPSA